MSNDDDLLVFRRVSRRLPRRRLREFAERLRDRVARRRGFTCLLTGDREIRRLNREFRGHDRPTDVLSFPSPEAPESRKRAGCPRFSRSETRKHAGCPRFLGDVAISVDRAAGQAREHGHGIEAEIAILMLHGLLHLLGYDHESDAGRMKRAEARWRRKLSLPAGLIERLHS